jgi:hypothetical protein
MKDNVLHELVHAKQWIERQEDVGDHGPRFLKLCSQLAANYDIKMKFKELKITLDGGYGDNRKIKKRTDDLIYELKNEKKTLVF